MEKSVLTGLRAVQNSTHYLLQTTLCDAKTALYAV